MKKAKADAENAVDKPVTTKDFDLKIPDQEIYYKGWVRYFHYSTAQHSHTIQPKVFFQNNRFYGQRVRRPNHKKKDGYGYLAIPNKAAFFAILYKDNFAIFSGRDDTISRQVDNLPIKFIGDVPEDDILKGGVRNMGDFPTGSCVDVEAGIPAAFKGPGVKHYWNVCFDDPKEKEKFMKVLIRLRVKYQRFRNPMPVTTGKWRLSRNKSVSSAFNKPKSAQELAKKEVKKSIIDGYWVTLQDWTDCNLKCGGGLSYQQSMCVPPKNGGTACHGKAVKTRPCNVQPCPTAKKMIATADRNEDIRKPVMKVGRFSNRPQKFSKCLMKENDAFLTTFDEKGEVTKKIPVRILMNNQTLSIFQDDDYEDLLFAYDLAKTNYAPVKKYCCFGIQDNEKQAGICGYPENCGVDPLKNEWANQWHKDLYLFKVLCKTGRQESMLTPDDLKQIDEPAEKLDGDGVSPDMVQTRKAELRKDMQAEENNLYKKNIAQTEETGFKAIEREINVENLVKKEEEAKETMEIKDLEALVKKEEHKATCIHKTIEEKDYDSNYDDKMEALDDMQRLKLKINAKVVDSRNRIKGIIAKMRKGTERKKDALQDKIKAIRYKMAKEILLANKEGDIKLCRRGKKDLDFRTGYCNKNFVDDYVNNAACNSNEDFCYTCCEFEFGASQRVKRNVCYKMCDDADKPVHKNLEHAAKTPEAGYTWLWAPQVKTTASAHAQK